MDDKIFTYFRRMDDRIKVIFVSSFLFGVIAHGQVMFNIYSLHDDAYSLFTVGSTYTSGRWMLEKLSRFVQAYSGGLFSIPLYEGMISIFFIANFLIIVVKLLDIQSKTMCFILVGVCQFSRCCRSFWLYVYKPILYLFHFFTSLGGMLVCRQKWYFLLVGRYHNRICNRNLSGIRPYCD